jgi:hypothetical protein
MDEAPNQRSTGDLLGLWEFPASFPLAKITEIAHGRLAPPDARAVLVSSRGDVITVQLVEGRLTEGGDFLVYVGGRGAFEVIRREAWPGGRALVILKAWPSRPYTTTNTDQRHPGPRRPMDVQYTCG